MLCGEAVGLPHIRVMGLAKNHGICPSKIAGIYGCHLIIYIYIHIVFILYYIILYIYIDLSIHIIEYMILKLVYDIILGCSYV